LLERRVEEELSIGDFVLSGGELAAMAVIDAVVRQLPGALGDEASAIEESSRRRAARLPAVHAARDPGRWKARD
jgi:tRNA (guanine-N1)-methyltransferase